MTVLSNRFERRWGLIFLVLYVLIMLPLPFFYSEEYLPSLFGLPSFLIGWTIHTAVTALAIALFARQALRRPEYRDFSRD